MGKLAVEIAQNLINSCGQNVGITLIVRENSQGIGNVQKLLGKDNDFGSDRECQKPLKLENTHLEEELENSMEVLMSGIRKVGREGEAWEETSPSKLNVKHTNKTKEDEQDLQEEEEKRMKKK
ncbi:hypothetical protein HPP92_000721 [Vanilla planifolia]|uniref:Uncharacterized protein n=1 Tax=Vanilla planifolia TaxID=51239 RepID=A0A835VGD2_VANPL|nr:hypothetical protein HPP92_000721 [Vanilla planifolia]